MTTSAENLLAGRFSSPEEQRERLLDHILHSYGVADSYANVDPEQRYVGVLASVIDGEGAVADSFDSLDEAREWIAGTVNDAEHPTDPLAVIDLDTGRRYSPRIEVRVTLDEPAEQPGYEALRG